MRLRAVCCGFVAVACLGSFAAEEKKPEKKKEPPRICVVIPPNLVPGITNKLKIRGLNLTNVTEVRFAGWEKVEVAIKAKGKADVPKEQDAKKWGDTQLEVEVRLPGEVPNGTNTFKVISIDGESPAHVFEVIPAESLVIEKEPNGSFKQAQRIEFGKVVQGTIGEAKDVDVFRFEGKGGVEIVAEIAADRYGSLLDAILTLYDRAGHIIASNDDTDASNDARLKARLPTDGIYYLSVMDANDKGGQVCVYNVWLKLAK